MLTEEQIKNLKKGAPIVIHSLFDNTDGDGDIRFRTPSKIGGSNIAYISPDCVSLPSDSQSSTVNSQSSTVNSQSKHDPTRLFKKGDKVRVIKCKGRSYSKYWEKRLGQILTVTWSEDETTSPEVDDQTIDPAYLELVTPVEEMEPYEVTESSDYYGVDKDDLEVEAAIFWKKAHPNAKAAAEAECARLNAEYRKEHGNA